MHADNMMKRWPLDAATEYRNGVDIVVETSDISTGYLIDCTIDALRLRASRETVLCGATSLGTQNGGIPNTVIRTSYDICVVSSTRITLKPLRSENRDPCDSLCRFFRAGRNGLTYRFLLRWTVCIRNLPVLPPQEVVVCLIFGTILSSLL